MRWRNLWFTSVWCLFLLLGMAMVWQPGELRVDTGARILGVLLVIVGLVGAVRSWRVAILVSHKGIVVRQFHRTRQIPWASIKTFNVIAARHLLPWRELSIELTDGRVIRAGEVASLARRAEGTQVWTIAAELNDIAKSLSSGQ